MFNTQQAILRKLAHTGRCQYSTTKEFKAAIMLEVEGLVKVNIITKNKKGIGCKAFGSVESLPLL